MTLVPFASRAGEKLEHGITTFDVPVKDKVCADFGSSVGGFVDCLLRHGAAKVYAIDTGYGELAWKLRIHPAVVVMEKTNAMHVSLWEKVDIITNDTSWTKQDTILPNILNNLKEDGSIITLIKPHYEADKKLLRKGKLPDDIAEAVAKQTVDDIQKKFNLVCRGFTKSPIVGSKGKNTEYIAYLVRS